MKLDYRILITTSFTASILGCAQEYMPEEETDEPVADVDTFETGGSSETDPIDEPTETTWTGTEAFEPTEGSWITLREDMLFDDCDMADWVTDGPGDILTIELDADLFITHSRGTEACSLSGTTYGCDMRVDEDTTAIDDYGLNALITLELTTSGYFDDTEAMIMQTDIVADCEGDDCWLVELSTAAMPCDMAIEIEAEAQ